MTPGLALLRRAEASGLTIRAEGGRLLLTGRKPSPDLLAELRAQKPALLAVLADRDGAMGAAVPEAPDPPAPLPPAGASLAGDPAEPPAWTEADVEAVIAAMLTNPAYTILGWAKAYPCLRAEAVRRLRLGLVVAQSRRTPPSTDRETADG
jgi:hypothetical protein